MHKVIVVHESDPLHQLSCDDAGSILGDCCMFYHTLQIAMCEVLHHQKDLSTIFVPAEALHKALYILHWGYRVLVLKSNVGKTRGEAYIPM